MVASCKRDNRPNLAPIGQGPRYAATTQDRHPPCPIGGGGFDRGGRGQNPARAELYSSLSLARLQLSNFSDFGILAIINLILRMLPFHGWGTLIWGVFGDFRYHIDNGPPDFGLFGVHMAIFFWE